jgi:hypothetical protein
MERPSNSRKDPTDFPPSKVMHYAIGYEAMRKFIANDPANTSIFDPDDGRVSDRLLLWADSLLSIGFDGAIMVDVLEDFGLEIKVRCSSFLILTGNQSSITRGCGRSSQRSASSGGSTRTRRQEINWNPSFSASGSAALKGIQKEFGFTWQLDRRCAR